MNELEDAVQSQGPGFPVQRLVSWLLRRGYYPVAAACAGEGAQLVDGTWHMPRWGCDTLQHVLDEHGDELPANAQAHRKNGREPNHG